MVINFILIIIKILINVCLYLANDMISSMNIYNYLKKNYFILKAIPLDLHSRIHLLTNELAIERKKVQDSKYNSTHQDNQFSKFKVRLKILTLRHILNTKFTIGKFQ